MTAMKVLIIGSGPVGSTFARTLWEDLPDAEILMVDIGPKITSRYGTNVKNLATEAERTQAQIRSQGPAQFLYPNLSIHDRANAAPGQLSKLARPGTHLVTLDEAQLSASGMPAAAMSTNVGGMGAHWTCACPRPGRGEAVEFIPAAELDEAFTRAESLLKVSSTVFAESPAGSTILETLSGIFDLHLPSDRKVRRMPLACDSSSGAPIWSGADTVLGHLATPDADSRFRLRSETICRRLLTFNNRVTGAVIEHIPTSQIEEVHADVVVAAADSLRTPQLLWVSGIRPRALGHYLNDHMWTFAAVALHPHLISGSGKSGYRSPDNTIGVFQVPFHGPTHPFHAQIMHMDVSPVQLDGGQPSAAKHVVGTGWSGQKELQFSDCITFSDRDSDYFGMPRMTIDYHLTSTDRATLAAATAEQTCAAAALGSPVFSETPLLVPPGTSLHYQGSVRMGAKDDGESVCDSHSRVWGFENLFVGGNGVIPTATACNPTLTSVALAGRAARFIGEL
jgi:choline dehydrogenase-like flavoprotein